MTNTSAPSCTQVNEIWDIIRSTRDIFIRILADSTGTTETGGSCLYACILLSDLINRFTKAQAKICGGGPPDQGGARAPDGQMHGHYWVQLDLQGHVFVADITADQFGYEPMLLLPMAQAQLIYTPGDQRMTDETVKETREDIEKDLTSLPSIQS